MRGFLSLTVAGVGLLFAGGTLAPLANEPRWLTDLEQAKQRAQAAGKPIFLVFR